jgi:hypothetical protein
MASLQWQLPTVLQAKGYIGKRGWGMENRWVPDYYQWHAP